MCRSGPRAGRVPGGRWTEDRQEGNVQPGPTAATKVLGSQHSWEPRQGFLLPFRPGPAPQLLGAGS